jgi:hypothetical protein
MSDLSFYFPITPETLAQAARDNLESGECDALLGHAAKALKAALHGDALFGSGSIAVTADDLVLLKDILAKDAPASEGLERLRVFAATCLNAFKGRDAATPAHASISIAPSEWRANGEYQGDPRARLSTRIDINDVTLQLEAYAKSNDDDEFHVVDEELDGILTTLVGDGAYPLQTTTIDGREYILLATPTGA